MKKIFTKVLFLLMVTIFSFTYVSCKKRNLGTYYEVKYEVDSKEYAKYFVEEGKLANPIVAPAVEGKEFVFWMLDSKEYNFNKPVNEDLTLVALYENEEGNDEISSAIKTQLEKIITGATFTKVQIATTDNLKAEYQAVKNGKKVSIYYLEKANNFTTVKLYVGIDDSGKIVNMVTTQSDTIGKGDNFNGSSMGLNGATSSTIDESFISVSGATVSSNTVKELIHLAFAKFINDNPSLLPGEEVTITFDSNGGTNVKPIIAKSGSTFVRPNDPTRSLYHFVGWFLNDQPYDFSKLVTSNITLVAKWISVFQFDSKTQTIVDATDLAGDIEIPTKINGVEVKALGENLFKNNRTITSVVIPESIEYIAFSAFEGCTNLKSVTFLGTQDSEPLDFGINIFKDCIALNNISLPANATTITTSMFEGCKSLIQLPINSNINHIGTSAFKNCVQLAAISLPEGIKSIESNAFENCKSLIAISLPTTLTKIGEEAFANCSQLVSIYIPEGVTNINLNAFNGCLKLVSINVSDNNKNYASLSGALYNKSLSILYLVPNKSLTTFEIKKTVTNIQVNALANLTKLETITVEEGTTKYQVYNNVLYSITNVNNKTTSKLEFIPAKYSGVVTILANTKDLAANVFANCPNITEISIEEGNEFFFEIDHLIYRRASVTSTYYTLVVANRNFNGIATILKDTVGTLSSIDASCFTNTNLTGIRFTSTAQITYVSDDLFGTVPAEFKVYIPHGQTNNFVGIYNNKWSLEFKDMVSKMLVEDGAN